MLLALDTSTRLAGIALYSRDRGLIAEHNWYSANLHTVELMPEVSRMLARAGASPATLEAIAVAQGPGSFTGLRVAMSAAKGLALALEARLLGIPTLDAVAYPHQAQPIPVIAFVQAGRGRVCWAPYAHGPDGWAAQAPFRLSSVAVLIEGIVQPTLFAGELLAADQEAIALALGHTGARFLPPALAMRRAGYVAELAWGRYAAGRYDDPATLSPIYLHEPGAPALGRAGVSAQAAGS